MDLYGFPLKMSQQVIERTVRLLKTPTARKRIAGMSPGCKDDLLTYLKLLKVAQLEMQGRVHQSLQLTLTHAVESAHRSSRQPALLLREENEELVLDLSQAVSNRRKEGDVYIPRSEETDEAEVLELISTL